MADASVVRSKVENFIREWNLNVQFTDKGYRFKYESTMVSIEIVPQEDRVLVHLWAWILNDVQESPEVFQWVATSGGDYWMGAVQFVRGGTPAQGLLVFKYTLLGDFLDNEELANAVRAVANTADELDDELQKKFGGERFID